MLGVRCGGFRGCVRVGAHSACFQRMCACFGCTTHNDTTSGLLVILLAAKPDTPDPARHLKVTERGLLGAEAGGDVESDGLRDLLPLLVKVRVRLVVYCHLGGRKGRGGGGKGQPGQRFCCVVAPPGCRALCSRLDLAGGPRLVWCCLSTRYWSPAFPTVATLSAAPPPCRPSLPPPPPPPPPHTAHVRTHTHRHTHMHTRTHRHANTDGLPRRTPAPTHTHAHTPP